MVKFYWFLITFWT